MTKSILNMTDDEFTAHHARGAAQIAAYSAKLDSYARNVSRVSLKLAAFDAAYPEWAPKQ